MKKSKSKSLMDMCLLCGAILFGALALILMVAPGIVIDLSLLGEAKYSVYELINYDDELRIGVLLAVIFAVCLLVSALVSLVVKLMNKKCNISHIIAFCASVLAIIAGVMLFMSKSLVGLADSTITTLGIGAILAGIFEILAGASLIGYAIVKMKK